MTSTLNFWDQRFAEPGYKYGLEPNAFLHDQARRLNPASAVLVPGDGEGRNGVWLAEQGHAVKAVDSSAVGLQKAGELAASRGVSYATELADLSDWAPAAASLDAVVLIYTHLPGAIRQSAHRRLAQGLKPGGWLILEAFHPAQLAHRSGGPKDADMLYTPEQLSADFDGLLSPVLAWQGKITLSEGPGHQGLAHVTRWVGQRPPLSSSTLQESSMKTAHDLVTAAKIRIQEIPLDQAEAAIRDADLLLDVREVEEYAAGHLNGATHISRGMLEFKFSATPALQARELKIVLYCKTSGRAALSALALLDMGYLNIQSLAGGYDAWVAAGKPVVKPQSPAFE